MTSNVPWPANDPLSPMKRVYNASSDLQTHCDNLKGMVQQVVSRNSLLLAGRYVDTVKEEEHRLGALLHRVQVAQRELEHSPIIDSLNSQIVTLKSQVTTMDRHCGMLEQQATSLHTLLETRATALSQLREELNQLTKANMSLSYEIDEQPKGEVHSLHTPVENTINFPINDASKVIESRLSDLKNSINRLETEVKTHSKPDLGASLRVDGFFLKCVRAAKHELLKSQELPKDSRGLQGSLYFELIGVREKPIAEIGAYRSNIQDRDYRNVVYYAVKRMMASARSSKKQQQLAAMGISLEQLKRYAPMQIIGLLCLRPDVVQEIEKKVFPAPGQRRHDETPIKTHTPLPSLISSRHLPRELHLTRSRLGREVREKHSMSLL